MDPISASSAYITLISGFTALVDFIKAIRNAPEELEDVKQRLQSYRLTLEAFKESGVGRRKKQDVRLIISNCKTAVEKLRFLLRRCLTKGTLWYGVMWTLNRTEAYNLLKRMGDHIQALCGTSQAITLHVSQKIYSKTESINGVVQQVAVTLQSVETILSKLKPFKTPLGEAPLSDPNAICAAAFRRRELSKEEVIGLDIALVQMDPKTTAEEVNDILARGACPNLIALPAKDRPLFIAAQLRRHDLVRALLTFGAYPNLSARYPKEKPEDLEKYPIHLAAINGDATTANLLLRSGADINALTSSKQTALQLAASRGSDGLDVLRLLLSNSAKPNILGCPFPTALYIAIHLGESDAVLALLEAGADPNHNPAVSDLDRPDQPPLHAAVQYCTKYSRDTARFKIVGFLVQHGADITLPAVFSDPSTKHIKEDMNTLAWLAYLVPQGDLRSQLERILHGTRGNIREGIYYRDKDASCAC